MSLNLNKDSLVQLIEMARKEIVLEEADKNAIFNMLAQLTSNQMQMYSEVSSHLRLNYHSSYGIPATPFNIINGVSIPYALKCEDEFSKKLKEKIRKQAMYHAYFSDINIDFPDLVVKEIENLLKVKTDVITLNELELRCLNICILCNWLKKDLVDIGVGDFIINVKSEKNGSTPYKKISIKYINPVFEGNDIEITREVYSYQYNYNYLKNEGRSSFNVSGNHSNSVFEVPAGFLKALDEVIYDLYAESNVTNDRSIDNLITEVLARITANFKEIVDTCLPKIVSTEDLSHKEKLYTISRVMNEKVRYTNPLFLYSHKVMDLSSSHAYASEDGESLLFELEVSSFFKAEGSYEKQTVKFGFDHLRESTVHCFFMEEDYHVKLYNYWILHELEKHFVNVKEAVQLIGKFDKYGNY